MDRVPVMEPLYDAEFQLTGRPDYLVQDRSSIIPVEVKSSHVADTPYEGHILQLAAYCRLVEAEFGKRPEYGIINYPDKSFSIDYTVDLQKRLHQELYDLRYVDIQPDVNRSHNSPGRCRMCGYRSICEEKLN
jgi:CRISPR-associated exonuclease Cas4